MELYYDGEYFIYTDGKSKYIVHPNYKMKISREVAKNATVESAFNSPVTKMFLTCREMVDLLRWNNSAIWSNVSHTVSSCSVTSIFDTPSGVVYSMMLPLSSIAHVECVLCYKDSDY